MDPQSESRTPRAGVIALLVILAGILGVIVIVAAFFLRTGQKILSIDPLPAREISEVGEVRIQALRSLAELTTVEAVAYTTVEKGTDRGWLNWATGDKVTMFAVARIGAGIDLSNLEQQDIEVDADVKAIRIKLPAPEITYVALDNEATHVYDRDTGIFTKGSPDLEQAARLAAEEILVQEVIDQGLLSDAAISAERVIHDFLAALGYEVIDIDVDR